jgi:hypothetical protein
MESEFGKLQSALKHYEAMRRAQRKYYTTNKEEINKKMMERYREKNPEIKKRGRKPKVVEAESPTPTPPSSPLAST